MLWRLSRRFVFSGLLLGWHFIMTDDERPPLVERLRWYAENSLDVGTVACKEAADRIEELERQLAQLRESTSTAMVMRLRNQFDEQVARAEAAESQLATARQQERERCAKMCESFLEVACTCEACTATRINAKAIRALPDEEGE